MGREVGRGLARRRGVSTIIGSLFFILILLIGLSLFTWEIREFDDYNAVIMGMVESDTERLSELLAFEPPVIDPDVADLGGGLYRITALLKNHGGVDVNVTRIYIHESTGAMAIVDRSDGGPEGFTGGYIPTGSVSHPVTITSTLDPVDGAEASNYTYEIRVATERGRTFTSSYPYTLYEPPTPPAPSGNGTSGNGGTNASAPVTYQGEIAVGPVALNLTAWSWTADSNSTDKWPGWYIERSESDVIWFVTLRNVGDHDLTLLPASHLLLRDAVNAMEAYILSPTSTVSSPVKYAGDVVIPSSGSVEILFGANKESGRRLNDAPRSGHYAVSVVLYMRDDTGYVWALTLPYLATESE